MTTIPHQSLYESLLSLYSQNIEADERTSILDVPIGNYGTLGLLPPHPIFWVQLTIVLIIQSTLNSIAAVIIYVSIVQHRGSTRSYLVGYGIICPLLIVVPFHMFRILGLHNMAMLVGQSASMMIVLFRCLMAIHGTLPTSVEQDLPHFVMFFVAPIQFEFDTTTGEPIPLPKNRLSTGIWKTIQALFVLAVVLGVAVHHRFEVFAREPVNTFWDLFYWQNLLNNYVMAYLTGAALNAGSRMVGTLVEMISGKAVIELCDNPMTASTSPSEFWGRRWNALVHVVLKGGVYIPLRKNGVAKGVAAVATFAASGLLHEYILTALASKGVLLEDDTAYMPNYGYHLAFFVWNGLVLMLEGLFYEHFFVQGLKQNLPEPIIVATVIMMVLPIGHWFTDEYAEIGFYDDIAVGFPTFVWTPGKYQIFPFPWKIVDAVVVLAAVLGLSVQHHFGKAFWMLLALVTLVHASPDTRPSHTGTIHTILQDVQSWQQSYKENNSPRPFVTISYAQSIDGKIALLPPKNDAINSAPASSSNFAISDPESLRMTHALRSIHDAILVGGSTLSIDNPRLNNRLWLESTESKQQLRQPLPVVLDTHLQNVRKLGNTCRASNLLVCCSPKAAVDKSNLENLPSHVKLLPCPLNPQTNRMDLVILLRLLKEKHGIESIMVEGGARVLSAFLSHATELVDCLCITISPKLLLWQGLPAIVTANSNGAEKKCDMCFIIDRHNFASTKFLLLGEDSIFLGRIP